MLLITTLSGFLALSLIEFTTAGVVNNVKIDPACTGATLYEFRLTDCTTFPCTIRRQKEYTIEAEFSMEKDVKNPNVRCGTIYLGRQVSLPGYGSCDTITNATCPLSKDIVYQTRTTFNIPYYVPPTLYTVSCRLEDDDGQPLVCGQGSGRVI